MILHIPHSATATPEPESYTVLSIDEDIALLTD
jgi:hypothetical protein